MNMGDAKGQSMEDLLRLAQQVVQEAEADAEVNPKPDLIQVVVVEPNKKPYKKTIKNDLDSMKEIVQGWIEILRLGKSESGGQMAITLNEEGKLIPLPLNRIIIARKHHEILVGTFFITAYNKQGDNITLQDGECEKLIKKFTPMEIYL